MAGHPSQTLVSVSPYNQSMVYHTFYYPPLNPTHPAAHLKGKQKPGDVERGLDRERDVLLDNGIEVPEGRRFLLLLLFIMALAIAGTLASLVTFRNMPPLPAAPQSKSRYDPLSTSRPEDVLTSRKISLASDEYSVLRFSSPSNASEGTGRCSVVVTASELAGVEVHQVLHDAVHPERLVLVASDDSESDGSSSSASSSTFLCDERGPIWIRVSRSDSPMREPVILDVHLLQHVTVS